MKKLQLSIKEKILYKNIMKIFALWEQRGKQYYQSGEDKELNGPMKILIKFILKRKEKRYFVIQNENWLITRSNKRVRNLQI